MLSNALVVLFGKSVVLAFRHFALSGHKPNPYGLGEVRQPRGAPDEETNMHDKIQKIALENRFYGYRRVCRDLWRIHGLKVNHKHVPHASCARTIFCACAPKAVRSLHHQQPA